MFIQRTPPYLPSENSGITPSDFQYNSPTEICDEHNEFTVIEEPEEDYDADYDSNDDLNHDFEDIIPLDPIENSNEDNKYDKDKLENNN